MQVQHSGAVSVCSKTTQVAPSHGADGEQHIGKEAEGPEPSFPTPHGDLYRLQPMDGKQNSLSAHPWKHLIQLHPGAFPQEPSLQMPDKGSDKVLTMPVLLLPVPCPPSASDSRAGSSPRLYTWSFARIQSPEFCVSQAGQGHCLQSGDTWGNRIRRELAHL